MDVVASEHKGFQLLHEDQREELKSKWRSWLERKISSETNRDHIPKWEQLLYNNHSSNPDLENNQIGINQTEENVDTEEEHCSNSLSKFSDLCKCYETSNLPQESLKRSIENIEEDSMMNRQSWKNTKGFIDTLEPINTTSNVRVDQQGCKYESQREVNDQNSISQNIPSSMDTSLYSERYKKDWDNISDFPNVGSVMSTSNIETDSFTDKCDPDLENAINDHVNLPKYYCPYPPKVPRNKHENNDLRRISAVGTETGEEIHSADENYINGISESHNYFGPYFPHASPQLSRLPEGNNGAAITYNPPTSDLHNFGSKSTICEHKYDNFPGVNKAKWMELLDSWKIGGRFVRPSFLQTNCSAQSSVSPISDCSTEGRCRINGNINSLDNRFFKVGHYKVIL